MGGFLVKEIKTEPPMHTSSRCTSLVLGYDKHHTTVRTGRVYSGSDRQRNIVDLAYFRVLNVTNHLATC